MITKESPLQGKSIGSIDTVAIREIPGLHTIDLRVTHGTPAFAAVVEVLDMELPVKTGHTSEKTFRDGNEVQALCLGPDWWLIVGMPDAEEKLELLRSNNDYHFSAVNVSGQRTTIELEGPHAREVLAQLWEQDLREKSFRVGSVSQGLMMSAPVIVLHVAPLRYRLMVRSSFGVHVWRGVVDVREEWV